MKWLVICVTATAMMGAAWAEEPKKDAAKKRLVERDGFRVELPKAWGELPDVATNAANAILGVSTDYSGGAMAAGDPSQGIMVVVFWIKSNEKMTSVRTAVEDYQRGIKEAFEEAGTKLSKWEATERAATLSVAGEGTDGDVVLRLASVAAVGKDDRLSGWTAQCIHASTSKKGPAQCAEVLSSFAITAPEADLKLLEKDKKKKK